MTDEKTFDHRPDPELGSALRRALDPPRDDQAAFVARVMARYDGALAAATVPTWEVLAAWSRPRRHGGVPGSRAGPHTRAGGLRAGDLRASSAGDRGAGSAGAAAVRFHQNGGAGRD